MCVCVYVYVVHWVGGQAVLMLADVLACGRAAESMGRRSDLVECHVIISLFFLQTASQGLP